MMHETVRVCAAHAGSHEAMFGRAGALSAELILRWAPRLFAVPIDPLSIRVVLAPIEIGPYNGHTGYHFGNGSSTCILGNRHQCEFLDGELTIRDGRALEDFLVHELTHARQAQLLRQHGWPSSRRPGSHRDKGWYTAIAEACPAYLKLQVPPALWPTGPRTRAGTLTEPEMTHWPRSLRALVDAKDPRLTMAKAA
jgi:hypothetical protein